MKSTNKKAKKPETKPDNFHFPTRNEVLDHAWYRRGFNDSRINEIVVDDFLRWYRNWRNCYFEYFKSHVARLNVNCDPDVVGRDYHPVDYEPLWHPGAPIGPVDQNAGPEFPEQMWS